MNDDELRGAYQLAVTRRSDASRAACPPTVSLAAIASHTADAADRVATREHVATCAHCRRDLDLLRTVESAGAEVGGTARVPTLASRRPLPWRGVLAAAAMLVVAAGAWNVLGDRGDDGDIARGGASTAVPVAPVGMVTADARRFAWRPAAGATSYALSLIDQAARPAFGASTSDTTLALPDSVRLVPGADYVWTVEATLADGTRRRSAPARFRLATP